jgi:DNA-directed RNA polymerase specialized sigma24 family protein
MYSNHVVIQDPAAISARFSTMDRLGYDGTGDVDADLEQIIDHSLALDDGPDLKLSRPTFSVIEPYLIRIPPREADLIRLYYRDQMKQEQIARMFGITQAAVSYRLARGRRRIQFLFTIPELDFDLFEMELGPKFTDQDREILWRMYETTCQSKVAKQMNLTQGKVRHRFFSSLSRIKDIIREELRERKIHLDMVKKRWAGVDSAEVEEAEHDLQNAIKNSCYSKYWKVFFAISDKHFNILHEVSLPQFTDRGDAQILAVS